MTDSIRGRISADDDLSHGRVPAAIELARQLAEAELARRERHAADERVRACAHAVLRRYEHARAVGWTHPQLVAAGLVPPDDIVAVTPDPDSEPDREPDPVEL